MHTRSAGTFSFSGRGPSLSHQTFFGQVVSRYTIFRHLLLGGIRGLTPNEQTYLGTARSQHPGASYGRLRLPKPSRVLALIFVLLLTGDPEQLQCHTDKSVLASRHSVEEDRTGLRWWLQQLPVRVLGAFVGNFGLSFASSALCKTNICNAGACYEHGTAQVCICPLPSMGPTCLETASLCTTGCGIRVNSGLDCSSALCSLGNCVDTNAAPFFKCECGDFFDGTNCEIPTNPCTSAVNPCSQATCIFSPGRGTGTVMCECYEDWEVAPGAGLVTSKWGNSEVVLNPPCSVRVSRGLAKISFSLSSGELIVWWTVFAASLCILLWCCYSVATESCGNCFKRLKFAGQVQKAAGA